jgi:hypothetical protein
VLWREFRELEFLRAICHLRTCRNFATARPAEKSCTTLRGRPVEVAQGLGGSSGVGVKTLSQQHLSEVQAINKAPSSSQSSNLKDNDIEDATTERESRNKLMYRMPAPEAKGPPYPQNSPASTPWANDKGSAPESGPAIIARHAKYPIFASSQSRRRKRSLRQSPLGMLIALLPRDWQNTPR